MAHKLNKPITILILFCFLMVQGVSKPIFGWGRNDQRKCTSYSALTNEIYTNLPDIDVKKCFGVTNENNNKDYIFMKIDDFNKKDSESLLIQVEDKIAFAKNEDQGNPMISFQNQGLFIGYHKDEIPSQGSSPTNILHIKGVLDVVKQFEAKSDKRWKTNIKGLRPRLLDVLNLRTVYFRKNIPIHSKQKNDLQMGLIAQETMLNFPEAVNQSNPDLLGIKQFMVDTFTIKAIQEFKVKKDQEIEGVKKYYEEQIKKLEDEVERMLNES